MLWIIKKIALTITYMKGTCVKIFAGVFRGSEHFLIYIGKCTCVAFVGWIVQSRHQESSVFCFVSWLGYGLLRMQLLSIWDVGKCLKADISGSLLFRRRKISDCMYSNLLSIAELWWFSIKLSGIGKCLWFDVNCSSDQNRSLLSSFSHVCSIHQFLYEVQLRSQCLPCSILENWKRM